jgi:hypothetical protein
MSTDPRAWLNSVEVEHTDDHPYCGGCPLTRATAALRAVLDAMDEADNKWHARALSTAVLRRAITDALTSEDPR